MYIISTTSDVFEWIIDNAVFSLQAFLDVNYYMVAFFLSICSFMTDSITETYTCASSILQCYYWDFLAFINELSVAIHFILSAISSFISSIACNVHFVLCCLIDFINSVHVKSVVMVGVVNHYTIWSVENVLYFTKLVFSAVLLILQLGPNLILLLYNTICFSIINIIDYLQITLKAVSHFCITFYLNCKSFIFNIPPKAYIGLILIVVIYHNRKTVRKYTRLCILSIRTFMLRLFSYMGVAVRAIFSMFHPCTCVLHRFLSSVSQKLTRRNWGGSVMYRYFLNIQYYLKYPFSKKEKSEEGPSSSQRERFMCVVCQDKEKNMLLIPCRHLCMCEDCTVAVQESYLGCPLCRKQIIDTVRAYT